MTASLWHRGLGTAREQLPRADRRDVGAGYAGAGAALCVSVLFALAMTLADRVGVGDAALALVALTALPLVVPAAFLSCLLVWRLVPGEGTYVGLFGGLLATLGTYLVSLAALYVFVLAVAFGSGSDPLGVVLTDAWWFVSLVGVASFLWTCWLTVPVGCLGGAAYERARTT
ncbi:hypothetical protein [Natronorarus salvus]|uniref:hypothetical protein n=1 Tax=Natronorarus salvus TaxID=3117733 RepID=UPI002F26CD49